jgi:hypothetical protein
MIAGPGFREFISCLISEQKLNVLHGLPRTLYSKR